MSQPPPPPRPPQRTPQRPGRAVPLVVGALLGAFDLVISTVTALGVGGQLGSGVAWVPPAIGLLVPVVLLFPVATRWWGVGLLMGYFLTLIVLGGACVALLSSVGG